MRFCGVESNLLDLLDGPEEAKCQSMPGKCIG